jgi:hypothetical protein
MNLFEIESISRYNKREIPAVKPLLEKMVKDFEG